MSPTGKYDFWGGSTMAMCFLYFTYLLSLLLRFVFQERYV